MNKKTFDDYNFKKIKFWQINVLERYGNLSVSFTTEKDLQDMLKEIEEKMNKKFSYKEQQEDSQTSSFTQKPKKQSGRPSNKKHWIVEEITNIKKDVLR